MKVSSFKWLFGRNSEFWPTNMNTGMWAWVGHRLTGILLVVYLFLHLSFLSQASLNHDSFDQLMETMAQPLFVLLDFLLVCAVIFHAMNGLRVVLFDMGIGIRKQKLVFWIMMAISAVLVLVGFWLISVLIFGGA
ncbi:MAG: succinate dehydrogenase, cytochrome b556 subunit [Candidatus Thermoplasmatota archaeon]|nr:succinate dehydrogenase, cytochrome b556 subunit [Candidatus Thermoplasmatota archaeon]